MQEMDDLNILAKRYREQVDSLQVQLDETIRKLTVVSEAIELLKKEGVFDQEKLFQTPTLISEKYKDKSMSESIEDVLRSIHPEKIAANFIHSELVKNGFSSDSKNLKRDVYTRLNRMEKGGKILSTKKGKGKVKKYFLAKKDDDKKATELPSGAESSTAR